MSRYAQQTSTKLKKQGCVLLLLMCFLRQGDVGGGNIKSFEKKEQQQPPSLSNKLKSAVICLREGNIKELKFLVGHMNAEEVKGILNVCTSLWEKQSSEEPIDTAIGPADILAIALHIPSIARNVVSQFVTILNCNPLSGRSALYCISHIQSYFCESARSCKADELSLLVDHVIDVATVCLRVVTHQPDDTSCMPQGVEAQSSVACMDLFPTIINVLHQVEQSDVWKRGGVAGVSIHRKHGELLDDFCGSHWPTKLVLPLANITTDIWPFLLPRHILDLKQQFLGAVPGLTSAAHDDLPGIIRVCMTLMDKSVDIEWLHIVRVLYAAIESTPPPLPTVTSDRALDNISAASFHSASVLTAEALLEQTFAQLDKGMLLDVVEALENTALVQLVAVRCGTYRERCHMDSHIEYDGVPALSASDMSLILLLTRCAVPATFSVSGLFGSSETTVKLLTCARAYLVVSICHTFIYFMENMGSSGLCGTEGRVSVESLSGICASLLRNGRASIDATEHIRDVTCHVIGYVSTGNTEPSCSSRHASSSSASASSNAVSWLAAARASTLISFVDLLTRHYMAVVKISINGLLGLVMEPDSASISCTTNENCTQDIICSICCVLFACVPECRMSITNLLLGNMLSFAPKGSNTLSSTPKRAKRTRSVTVDTAQKGYIFWSMTQLLSSLCTLYSPVMCSMTHVIESYIPAISLLPPGNLEGALKPVICLCSCSSSLLGVLMTLCRKSLLHSDPDRKAFAIRLLAHMLPVVPEQTQSEIVQTVHHVLTMPLCYHTLLHDCILPMFSTERGPRGIGLKATQILLEAFTLQMDKYFMSPQQESVIAAPLYFEPTTTIARECSPSDGVFTIRVNMKYLLHSVYTIEKYISVLNMPAGHISTLSDFDSLCALLDALLFGKNSPDGSCKFTQQAMDNFPHTVKYCSAVLLAANSGFLLQRSYGLGRECTEKKISPVDKETGDEASDLPGSLVRAHLGSFLCALQGVLWVLTTARSEEAAGGTEMYSSVCALVLCLIDNLCNIASCTFANDCSCSEVLNSLEGAVESSYWETRREPNLFMPLKPLVDVLLTVQDSYRNSRQVPQLPFSALFGIVSQCCALICQQKGGTCHKDDALNAVAVLHSVYEFMCGVSSEDTLIDLHLDRVWKLAIENGIVKEAVGRAETSSNSYVGRRRRRHRSSYEEPVDGMSSSSSDSDEEREELATEYDSGGGVKLVSDARPNDVEVIKLHATGSVLDVISSKIITSVRRVYQSLPGIIADRLDRTELKLVADLPRPVSGSQRRLRSAEYNRARNLLFAVRGSICVAMTHLLSLWPETETAHWQIENSSARNDTVVQYFCKELKDAIKDGLTVRNFKALTDLITKALSCTDLTQVLVPLGNLIADSDPHLAPSPPVSYLIIEALCNFGPSTPAPLIKNLVAIYLRIEGLNGCCHVCHALFHASGQSTDYPADIECAGLSQPLSVLVTYCCKNTKALDPIWLEVLENVSAAFGNAIDLERSKLSKIVGLVAATFIVSFVRSANAKGLAETPATEIKTVKRRKAENSGVLQALSQPQAIIMQEKVVIFDLVQEKIQKRVLAVSSKLMKSACGICMQLHSALRNASTLAESSVRRNNYPKRRRHGRGKELWSHQGSDSSASEQGFAADDDDDCESGAEAKSHNRSKSVGAGRVGLPAKHKTYGSSSHDIKKSLPVLTEILSSSEHTFLAINWDFPGRISPEVSGGMLTAILHKYDEIAKFSNLGVTLLSRVEELLVRVSEVMKFYSILMHKKDSRQVIEKKFEPEVLQMITQLVEAATPALEVYNSLNRSQSVQGRLSHKGMGTEKMKTKTANRKKRLRSRNSVIDEWLEHEDGADAYADLEDFLVF